MPLYEVEVRTVSSVYYLVEASNEASARVSYSKGAENGEFVESEDVVAVIPYDSRFDDSELTDDFEAEQDETDE